MPMIVRSGGSTVEPTSNNGSERAEVVRVNRVFVQMLGLSADELRTRPLIDWIHPDDRTQLEKIIGAGRGSACARHATERDEWLAFDWRVKTHDDDVAVLGRLHLEYPTGPVSPTTDLAGPQMTMAETLEAMARIAEAKNPGMRCSILLTDCTHEHVTVGAGPSLPDAYNHAVEGLRIGPAVGSCGTAAYWNVPVIVENIAEDPLWRDLRDAAAIAGVAACWSHPITSTDGTVLGAMALYDTEPHVPTQHQMDGLEIAARMVGLAVERNRLEEALRHATKMEALGVLAGGVAHDFNNTLVAILGNAELALDSLPEDSDARVRLQDIVTASTSATDLCHQMLAYAGRGGLATETLELNALVKEIAGLLRAALSKKATLINKLHDAPLGVSADRGQLRQVIMNLITNASQAIGDNEGRVVIATGVQTYTRDELEQLRPNADLPAGEYVVLTISDTGEGMTPATQSRIFDPFFTTKARGSGLGLAAVQGIVRRHGGTVAVQSTRSVGTTFVLSFPRVALPAAAADSHTAPKTRGTASGRCILVVDDEPLVLQVHGDILERGGYSVLRATDGQEAIGIFRRESDSIDCVLVDLSMPKLGGEQVFVELQKMRADVRVILTSGFTEEEFRERLDDVGFAGFIQKPTPMNVLLARVADVLQS